MQRAISRHDIVELKRLVDAGADVNSFDKDGRTPLQYACFVANEDAVRLLLDRGVPVNGKTALDRTPLHWSGSRSVAALLLARGASVKARDVSNKTPVYISRMHVRVNFLETLYL